MNMELALAFLGLYIAFLHLVIFVHRDQDSQYSDLGNISMNKVSNATKSNMPASQFLGVLGTVLRPARVEHFAPPLL